MYSFIVLGIIPGTSIQISFQAWLVTAVLLAIFGPVAWRELKLHATQQLIPQRQSIQASQLHSRHNS